MDQLAGLTEDARKLALDRFRLLQPHLDGNRPLKAVADGFSSPLTHMPTFETRAKTAQGDT